MEITKKQLLDFVAPCSIICYGCAEFKRGAICFHAKALNRYFDGFYELSGREDVKQFTQTLEFLSCHLSVCEGCRSDPKPDACTKGCFIHECAQQHHVDYCGECDEFPCQKVQQSDIFGEKDLEKWLAHNRYIKENDAMAFFQNFKDQSQYSHHKNNG